MIWFLGLIIIATAIYAISRQLDVRLVLTCAGLLLGLLAADPMPVVRTFLVTFSNERFVVPICSAMGFAYVLRLTECDQHLVHLLTKPLERIRFLVLPGAVLVGFLVNIPVISQTSTAVAIGSVLVPLLRAARFSAVTTGAALLLGSSIGGELLNPGAPELRTVADAMRVTSNDCVAQVFPLLMVQLGVATVVFWALNARGEKSEVPIAKKEIVESETTPPGGGLGEDKDEPAPFRVNFAKALVPLVPVTLLFLTGPPLNALAVPKDWLVDPKTGGTFESRLIGLAMLIGVVLAALTAGRMARDTALAFFEGAGYAFARIIGIIVAANCFGEGVRLIGLAELIGRLVDLWPLALVPTAGAVPLGFAWLCGSGMATTQSLFNFFVDPAQSAGVDPIHVGAVVSIASAAGRTMSPVAAVTLMAAALTDTNPLVLARRVAVPLLVGLLVVVIVATVLDLPQ